MNDDIDDELTAEDDPAAALYRQWHAQRETTRDLPGVQRRVVDALLTESSQETVKSDGQLSPDVLYRRYREERVSTPAATIDSILAAVEAERAPLVAETAVAETGESAAHDSESSRTALRASVPSALGRLFGLPGRLLDRAGSALGDAIAPSPLRRALPAIALAAVTLAVAPLLLVDRGAVTGDSATIAALPSSLLDEASALATGIDPAVATGIGFGGGDRAALAFSVGSTVTDLVVLANAERSPSIERSLVRVRARLQSLADTLGDARVSTAATKLSDASLLAPDAAIRPALKSASDALHDALSDESETALRFEIGSALAFLELAASLESGALRRMALDAAFSGLAELDESAAQASLGPEATTEFDALRALADESGQPDSEDVLRRVARLRLLLG